jgi:hypothetical protein
MVGAPLLLALVLRVSAIAMFLGVATGALLSQYIADDASLVLGALFTNTNFGSYVQLALLLLPSVLTLFFLRKTLSGAKVVLHIVPLIVTSAALATLIIGFLPGGLQHQIVTDPLGKALNSAQNVLIAASAALTIILAWITMGQKGRKHH